MPAYSEILVSRDRLPAGASIGSLTKEKNGANFGARSLSAILNVVQEVRIEFGKRRDESSSRRG